MFNFFKTRNPTAQLARELYGAVVTQARDPAFYRDFGVPDTPEGRYEMIALHLVLTLDRVGGESLQAQALQQETLETFVTDMDDAFREMGVGDTTVPKKVKKAAGGVYTRGGAYREAVRTEGNAALESALLTYAYAGDATKQGQTTPLAAYVRQFVQHLSEQPDEKVMAAQGIQFSPGAMS
jgi:cytochrome b pre-mRNA-processing protein 3